MKIRIKLYRLISKKRVAHASMNSLGKVRGQITRKSYETFVSHCFNSPLLNERKNLIKRYFLVIACLLFWSCIHRIESPSLPKRIIFKPYPLTIVLFQSKAFKNYNHLLASVGNFRSTIDLGTPSCTILTDTLKAMFDRVISINNIADTPNDYAGLLEPTIIGLNDLSMSTKIGTVEIIYSFILYDKNKQEITRFKISGRDFSGSWLVTDATGPAMQDAMAQLMVKFQDDPKIKAWLAANGVNQKQEDLN